MKPTVPIIILPYAVDIAIKISGVFMDRQIMLGALRDLVTLPKPPDARNLTSAQQELIVDHLSSASLKSQAVITAFISSFAAILIVYDAQAVPWIDWTLIVLLVLGATMISWVYPRPLSYFLVKSKHGVDRGTRVILFFCLYDVILATLSLLAAHLRGS
jgi:hypothetical protein